MLSEDIEAGAQRGRGEWQQLKTEGKLEGDVMWVPCVMGMTRSDWRRTALVAVCVGVGRPAREQGWKQGERAGTLKSGQ